MNSERLESKGKDFLFRKEKEKVVMEYRKGSASLLKTLIHVQLLILNTQNYEGGKKIRGGTFVPVEREPRALRNQGEGAFLARGHDLAWGLEGDRKRFSLRAQRKKEKRLK